ncbi:lysozyme family protein [Peribacillus glennii]|uniref:CwlT-like lysozyme domain-containing protein n=1 Tax=Peribacillus glennii TaxID=2303991 RepID=A0A372L7D1_9BACI|nr:lysozyme family protein [Peribacillus glennii]RFU61143.1 hypothetical protein D0466_19385 [Peribacillus glennii]
MKKRKRKRKKSKALFMLLTFCFAFIVLLQVVRIPLQQDSSSIVKRESGDPFEDAKKYTSLIHSELEKYHLEEYTMVLVALMQQESRGKGGDPMQASESAGLAPNTIKDPKQSIRQGVRHFHEAVAYGKRKKVDFPTIIQAYNMGIGYIDYTAKHGGKHTEELAKKFSMLQVNKKPNVYNCGGDRSNFRYPYCYGDFTYSTKVAKKIDSLSESVPASAGTSTYESF